MKKTSRSWIFAFLAAGALASIAGADDAAAGRFRGTGKPDPIRIENVRPVNGSAGQGSITFDLAWDHSWRAAWEVSEAEHGGKGTLKLESWDAAWVFVKVRQGSEGLWSHAMLATNRADHQTPAAATLDVGLSDAPSTQLGAGGKSGMGVFVYRKAPGSGPNVFKDVTLRWQHPISTEDAPFDPAKAELRVFAIQMVRVPECAFWLGDGSTNNVMGQFSTGSSTRPFRIENEGSLTLGGSETEDALTCRDVDARNPNNLEDFNANVSHTLPAGFPKGYRAFYCMRHEITRQDYTDFLNMISYDEQLARTGRRPSSPPGTLGIRPTHDEFSLSWIGISILKSGVAGADDPVVIQRETFVASRTRYNPGTAAVYVATNAYEACNFLSPNNGSFYAAWAGLRPMTELEFEKACRGPLKPVPNEYAWGTAQIAGMDATNGAYRLRNRGKPDETIVWEGDGGPDATHGSAMYKGLLVDEDPKLQCFGPLRVGIFATPTSDRVRAGASYWGILDLSGNVLDRCMSLANPAGREFAGTHGDGSRYGWKVEGMGARGGMGPHGVGKALTAVNYRTSDRYYAAALGYHDARHGAQGFRCVRTAP